MISIDVDHVALDRFMDRFPPALGKSMEEFRDRVGYKLEAESKRAAPAVTGNLRRMINYGEHTNTLFSRARYSKFVHGQPFHQNKMRRRETPFITNAISASETFIEQEGRKALRRVVE